MALWIASVWPPTMRTAGWPKLTLVGCALLTFACQATPIGPPPSPGQVSSGLTVVPASAAISLGDSIQFSAQIFDEAGVPVPVAAWWTADGGSIEQDGWFRAGAQTGTFAVVANGAEAVDTALVSVVESGSAAADIQITPEPASVMAGEILTFTANLHDENGNPVGANVTWSATGGTIDQVGRYAAGSEAGIFLVVAAEDSGLSDSVDVEVLEPSAPPPPPPPPPPGGELPSGPSGSWTLVFEDEFDGNSLDTSLWECGQFFGWNIVNAELQWYDCAQVSIGGGVVRLTAVKDGAPNRLPPEATDIEWSAGALFTRGKFEPQYGAFEARMKCPVESGSWCAFWTMPVADDWPNGEIDILEVPNNANGACPSQTAYFNTHWDDGGDKSDMAWLDNADTGSFHTYTAEWTPNEVVFFRDGVEVHRHTGASTTPQQPVYLILNHAVGGSWPCPPTGVGPWDVVVDYVRAWER